MPQWTGDLQPSVRLDRKTRRRRDSQARRHENHSAQPCCQATGHSVSEGDCLNEEQ